MKLSLCKSVNLQGVYTNHSIRATVITSLDNAGFEARHIIKLSSHKSEATVKDYSIKCPDSKRKEMFESLSAKIQPKNKKPKTATVSIAEPKENAIATLNQDILNMPDFKLEELNDYDTIDDNLLANLVYDLPTENQNVNNNNSTMTQDQGQTANAITPFGNNHQLNIPAQPQINTQFINRNVQNPAVPRLPQMYFPHSNVTINYNFGK